MFALGIILVSQVSAPLMAMDLPGLHKLPVSEVVRDSYHLVIQGEAPKGYFNIKIDLEENKIVSATWDTIRNDDRHSTADVGIVVLGIPGLILSAPLWLLAHFVYQKIQKNTGLSHHNLALYLKLKDQLTPQDANILRGALSK